LCMKNQQNFGLNSSDDKATAMGVYEITDIV
jgi:hypothetical protein